MPRRSAAPAFDLDRHLFFRLTQVTGKRDRQVAAALRSFGVRVAEWRALATLAARERCAMNELAELTTIDRTTLSRTVDRMVRAGWVTRLADADDMRITRLALAAAGERLFARVLPVVDDLNARAVAGLPEPVVGVMRWALTEMTANLDRTEARGNGTAAAARAA